MHYLNFIFIFVFLTVVFISRGKLITKKVYYLLTDPPDKQ